MVHIIQFTPVEADIQKFEMRIISLCQRYWNQRNTFPGSPQAQLPLAKRSILPFSIKFKIIIVVSFRFTFCLARTAKLSSSQKNKHVIMDF